MYINTLFKRKEFLLGSMEVWAVLTSPSCNCYSSVESLCCDICCNVNLQSACFQGIRWHTSWNPNARHRSHTAMEGNWTTCENRRFEDVKWLFVWKWL